MFDSLISFQIKLFDSKIFIDISINVSHQDFFLRKVISIHSDQKAIIFEILQHHQKPDIALSLSGKTCSFKVNYLQNNNASLYIRDMLLSHVPGDKISLEHQAFLFSILKHFPNQGTGDQLLETSSKLSGEKALLYLILKTCFILSTNVSHQQFLAVQYGGQEGP